MSTYSAIAPLPGATTVPVAATVASHAARVGTGAWTTAPALATGTTARVDVAAPLPTSRITTAPAAASVNRPLASEVAPVGSPSARTSTPAAAATAGHASGARRSATTHTTPVESPVPPSRSPPSGRAASTCWPLNPVPPPGGRTTQSSSGAAHATAATSGSIVSAIVCMG